jgi:putative spermidine/putrescine transport system substrate-binding protein
VAVIAVLGPTLTACGGDSDASSSSSGGSVVYTGFGGSGQEAATKAWFDDFSDSEGITVNQDDPTDYAKLQQMVKADAVTWDVVQGGTDYGVEDNETLTDIDCTVVACDEFTGAFPVYSQAVPLYIFSYVLAYNTDTFSDAAAPTGFSDLFDTDTYPGKRAVDGANGLIGLLEAALLADGVARDALYPLDVDRALTKLDTIKDDLVFYQDAQECITNVASGEDALGMCYNGRVTLAAEEGQPIDIAWGQQIQFCDYVFIPKGAPDEQNAQKLIAYIASAEHAGDIADAIPYAPANPSASASGKYADDVPTANELTGDDAPITPDMDWWNANREDVLEKVTEWMGA